MSLNNETALRLWAKMDGTLADSSPGGTNTGSLGGNATYAAGRLSQSVIYDGNGDYTAWGDFKADFTNLVSVGAWVNVTALGSFPMIFSAAADAVANTQGFELRLHNNEGKPNLAICTAGATTVITHASSVVNLGWTHVMGVYNGVDIRMYVNGIATATPVARTGNMVFAASPNFRSGTRGGGVGAPLTGRVDDLRVYNRELSAAEVLSIYKYGQSLLKKMLLGAA